jgi:hypothetical protein
MRIRIPYTKISAKYVGFAQFVRENSHILHKITANPYPPRSAVYNKRSLSEANITNFSFNLNAKIC